MAFTKTNFQTQSLAPPGHADEESLHGAHKFFYYNYVSIIITHVFTLFFQYTEFSQRYLMITSTRRFLGTVPSSSLPPRPTQRDIILEISQLEIFTNPRTQFFSWYLP